MAVVTPDGADQRVDAQMGLAPKPPEAPGARAWHSRSTRGLAAASMPCPVTCTSPPRKCWTRSGALPAARCAFSRQSAGSGGSLVRRCRVLRVPSRCG